MVQTTGEFEIYNCNIIIITISNVFLAGVATACVFVCIFLLLLHFACVYVCVCVCVCVRACVRVCEFSVGMHRHVYSAVFFSFQCAHVCVQRQAWVW